MRSLPSCGRSHGNAFTNAAGFSRIYFKRVSTYSQRSLTYETDTLNAFSGVVNRLELAFDVRFFWGMPRQNIPEFLVWNCSRFSKGNWRRGAFPSWSWAGCSGPIEFFALNERQRMMPHDRGFLYENKGSPWCPRYTPAGFKWTQDNDDARILRCDTRTAMFQLSCDFQRIKFLWPGCPSKGGLARIVMDCSSAISLEYDGCIVECMECGHFTKYDPPIWWSRVLLIKWAGDTATRIGAGEMALEMFEAAGPADKFVKLG